MSGGFERFIAIDWSGARGKAQRGIAVAEAGAGESAPRLVFPPGGERWSRPGVLDWLNRKAEEGRFLAGIDFSFAPPFLDAGCYFPDSGIRAGDAKAVWEQIEARTHGDSHLYAGSFVENPKLKPLFHADRGPGKKFRRRYRMTERECREQGLGPAETFFHLIGPTQVGLGSLSGMRFLLRLDPRISVWPFDPITEDSPVLVEIYARALQSLCGENSGKIRAARPLNRALEFFGSEPLGEGTPLDDHGCDALLSAAALRALSEEEKYWNSKDLTEDVKITEGWTFGVL